MNQTCIKHPQHHLHHHPQGTTHLDHRHVHHQHHFHPENHPWSPVQRTPHPKAGRDTSLNQLSSDPHDVDQGLSHGLSALLAETSPLAPYRLQWQAKAKAQEKITTHKWLLSRPFGTDMVNWLISRPSCVYKQNWLLSRPSETYTVDLHGHSASTSMDYFTPFKTI